MDWKFPTIFFGWWIVGATFVMAVYVSGVVFLGFTAIFEPLVEEFSWSYTQISLAASLRGMEEGVIAPVMGILVDRFGPRRLIVGGAVVMTVGLIFLSQIHSLGTFYASVAIIAIGVSACTSTVPMTAVVNWFRQKLGIASAIALTGFICGGLLTPFVVELVDTRGWRSAMQILAIGMLILIVPLALFFRHKPEPYGYLPDGRGSPEDASSIALEQVDSGKESITVWHAVKMREFWHLSLAFAIQFIALAGFLTHVLPFMDTLGIERATASLYVTLLSITAIAGRLIVGWIIDKFDKRKVTLVTFVAMALAMLSLAYAVTAGTGFLFIGLILFGIGWGGNAPLRASLTRETFGRKRFGSIFGFISGINMFGAMVGPPLAGWVFDTRGSYQSAWYILVGLSLLGLIAILTFPRKKFNRYEAVIT